MSDKVEVVVGPILPPPELEPGYQLSPIWPPAQLLGACPLCGMPLSNGAPVGLCGDGLAHVACGSES